MEKTMNDIIAFIEGAMKRDFQMEVFVSEKKDFSIIYIYNHNNDYIEIRQDRCNLCFLTRRLDPYCIENLSEIDILNFKMVLLKAKEYSKNKTLQFFDEFLGEEPSKKITNINDLDDNDA